MPSIVLDTALMWKAAAFAALLDAPLLALAARFVSNDLFRRLKWYLVAAAGLVFALIWLSVGTFIFWDSVYSAIFPAWFHWLLPFIYGPLFAAYALLFWWLSRRFLPRLQVIAFVLMGGLVSLVGHSVGILLGLFRVPMLAETGIAASLIFGIFEFIFYFCVILALACAARALVQRLRPVRRPARI
jgi:uncharacterized BrkB/YihY/UPF0761 family membrane protein